MMTATRVPLMRAHVTLAAALVLMLFALRGWAASEEIQVYLDDLTKPGHFGADIHNNVTLSGSPRPFCPTRRCR